MCHGSVKTENVLEYVTQTNERCVALRAEQIDGRHEHTLTCGSGGGRQPAQECCAPARRPALIIKPVSV